jgi:hypothetical protein
VEEDTKLRRTERAEEEAEEGIGKKDQEEDELAETAAAGRGDEDAELQVSDADGVEEEAGRAETLRLPVEEEMSAEDGEEDESMAEDDTDVAV